MDAPVARNRLSSEQTGAHHHAAMPDIERRLSIHRAAAELLLLVALTACGRPSSSNTVLPSNPHATSASLPNQQPSATPRVAPARLTPPDARAICRALDSAERDAWLRFVGLIPVEIGGALFVLHGGQRAVSRAIAGLNLRDTAVVPCTEARLVTWIPGQDTHDEVLAGLVATFEHEGATLVQQFVFTPAEGRERLRVRCKDARACCEFWGLVCSFRERQPSTTDACADGVAEPPPEWGIHCNEFR
jgi:hypothetical protein